MQSSKFPAQGWSASGGKVQSAKINKEEVFKKLKKVLDPELGVNIVDLGLIYDVVIKNNKVKIKMTLTSPGCPLSPYFSQAVENAVMKIKGVSDVDVDLTFDPPWTPERLSKETKVKLGL